MARISAYTALPSADGGDTLPILDVSATTTKKITKTAFLSDLIDGSLLSIGAVKANKADFSVADATARLALSSPFEGLTCYQKDVDAEYIYDGSAWRRQAQWEELGRTTLGVAGNTISCASLPARKHLKVLFEIFSTGGTIGEVFRFNNDTGTNYAFLYSANYGAGTNGVSQSYCDAASSISQGTHFGAFEISNVASRTKLVQGKTLDDNNGNATSSCNSHDITGKWSNTSAQITRVDLVNVGAGNFAIGSEMIILGKD